MQIINIAGYKFIPLNDLINLKKNLLDQALILNCKGTILLSNEGINISMAACEDSINAFKAFLKKDPRFADITYRASLSNYQPFRRMKVKLRKEIITMGNENIKPGLEKAPTISPKTLKQWLDEKRELTILDTRNDYEIQFGTFKNAVNLGIEDFGEFPEATNQLAKDKPVVMFCTGGIRCEKAALHLLSEGFSDVFQLEGGILNYFSEVGGEHYHGECFVFDERVALDSDLKETGTMQCLSCRGPIPKQQQTLATYIAHKVCSQCAP